MRWFRRHQPSEAPGEPLDLDALLRDGLRDVPSARAAITRLDQEERALVRQRKVIDRQFNRVTPGKVRRIAWSNSGNPQIETNMLVDAMREADAAQESSRANQLAAIDTRQQAIERAKRELEQFLKRFG